MAISPEYVANLTARINVAETCEELLGLKNAIDAQMTEMLGSVESAISTLKALIVAPGDIGAVITWISDFINSSILGPYNKAVALQAELIALQATLAAAIAAKSTELHCEF